MFLFTYEEQCTEQQYDRHLAVCDALKALEKQSWEEGDPVVFHGTDLMSASWIAKQGFRPTVAPKGPIGAASNEVNNASSGVHWGTLSAARAFAERRNDSDNPAVFFWIRLSDLEKQNPLIPDWFALVESGTPQDPEHSDVVLEDWDGDYPLDIDAGFSLRHGGSLVAVGGGLYEGVNFVNPLADTPVHPRWQEARDRRFETPHRVPYSCWPADGLVEATPLTHPPSATEEEVLERYGRRWPKADAVTAPAPMA